MNDREALMNVINDIMRMNFLQRIEEAKPEPEQQQDDQRPRDLLYRPQQVNPAPFQQLAPLLGTDAPIFGNGYLPPVWDYYPIAYDRDNTILD